FYPQGCSPGQAAIQIKKQFPEDKTFTISKEMWDKMDPNSRAGLILHEIIYEEMISLGEDNSVNASYINSYMTAGLFDEMSMEAYAGFWKEVEPKAKIRIQGVPFVAGSMQFVNGKLQSAQTSSDWSVPFDGKTVTVKANYPIAFDPSGN